MSFLFNLGKRRKCKEKSDGVKIRKEGTVEKNTRISTDVGKVGAVEVGATPPPESNKEVLPDSLEEIAVLPFSDIIALSCEFREVVKGSGDITSRRRFVAKMDAVASLMMQRKFVKSDVDATISRTAILQRIMQETPPVRARLALAIHRFCVVLDQELENEELEQGLEYLQWFRPNRVLAEASSVKNSATMTPAVCNSGDVAKTFDAAQIYHSLITNDKLPSLEEMCELFRRTTEVLKKEMNVLLVSLPCVMVGDIHGQWRDLIGSVMALGGELNVAGGKDGGGGSEGSNATDGVEIPGKRNYLFLGDYVDRGPQSLHCLALIFAAKLLAPEHVFLLRGNHENGETNRRYGFLNECIEHYPIPRERGNSSSNNTNPGVVISNNNDSNESNIGDGGNVDVESSSSDEFWEERVHPLWVLANEAFEALPLCALVSGCTKDSGRVSVCAMHGGLSPFVANSLDALLVINRFRPIVDGPLADLTWGDPIIPRRSESQGNTQVQKEEEEDEEEENGGNNNNRCKNHDSNNGRSTGDTNNNENDVNRVSATAAVDGGNVNDSSIGGASVITTSAAPLPATKRTRDDIVHRHVEFNYNKPIPTVTDSTGFLLSSRGCGHDFGEDVTLQFLQENKLSFVVRAHQCVQEGYQWQHRRRVLTIFSAPNYCGMGNKGAILILHTDGKLELVQFEGLELDDSAAAAPLPVPPRDF